MLSENGASGSDNDVKVNAARRGITDEAGTGEENI
jgi:hypothetical protein